MKQKTRREEKMDRQRADLLLDPRRLRNDDPNHRRGGYGRDRSPRSRSRIYLISPRGTTVPRQRVRPTLRFASSSQPPFLLFSSPRLSSPSLPSVLLHSVPRFLFPSRLFFAPLHPYILRFATPTIRSSPPTREQTRRSSLSVSLHVAALHVHIFVRECDRAGIPMLIKRSTDLRYLSHAWRRSLGCPPSVPDILSPTPSHELDEYIYKW